MIKRFLLALGLSAGLCASSFAQDQNLPAETVSTSTGSFINITEFGFARGIIHENRDQSFGFQTINGFEFNNRVSVGLGVGAEKYLGKAEYDNKVSNLTLLPVFSDVRVYFGKGKLQPFMGQSVGYAFCIDQPVDYNYFGLYDEKGGIMLSPSFGFRTNGNSKVNYIMNLGYRYQENTQEIRQPNYNGYQYFYYADGAQFKRFDDYVTFKFVLSF